LTAQHKPHCLAPSIVLRALPTGTGETSAHEFQVHLYGLHAGDRRSVLPSESKVLNRPDISSKSNHPSIDGDINMPGINSWVRE
jgi:hypothetical protein